MEEIYTTIYMPSEEEVNIHLQPIDGYTMDRYDFTCEVFCSPIRKQVITKKDMNRVDENNYTLWMKTSSIGVGRVKIKVLAQIPNIYLENGFRQVTTYLDPRVEIKD